MRTKESSSIAICICAHNSDHQSLDRAIHSICRQTIPPSEVLLVDNASEPALPSFILEPLRLRKIPCRLVRESNLGISHARVRAICETTTDWILFLDDDNELFENYIEAGLSFINPHPDVGCFGGRLILPSGIRAPRWVKSYLPWLAIKDGGDEVIINNSVDAWGVWEPAGAGCWIHRDILDEFMRGVATDRRLLCLGRRGHNGLHSCEESVIMRGAYRIGRANAYVPSLKLNHHLQKRRFNLPYLLRLMDAYGESHMLLDLFLKGRPSDFGYPKSMFAFQAWLVADFIARMLGNGWQYALGQAIYHRSVRRTFKRLSSVAVDMVINENQHCNSLP